MSKKAKSEVKRRRASNKRAVKEANRKKWQDYAGTETNRKKRSNMRRSGSSLTKHSHPLGACGNIGCLKCSAVARVAHVKLLLNTTGLKGATKVANRLGIIIG